MYLIITMNRYVGNMKLSPRSKALHFKVGTIVINKYKQHHIVTPKTKKHNLLAN